MSETAHKPVVIIGGGIAGLAVAKSLTENGLECIVIERQRRGLHGRRRMPSVLRVPG
ncbi:FAD-dependent oxidoreductase [Thermodesulfobacteriota bacterium]